MRALALCCLLSCLSSSALAVHHPLHKHRHDKEKRTEVLVVKEDTNVEDIEETVYLPGPPPEGYGQHPEDWKKDFKHVVYQSTTYTLPDGSVTVVSGPEPTNSGSGLSAGESTGVNSSAGSTPPSNPTTTSSAAGDSASDSSSGLLGGGEVSPSSTTNSAAASASLIQSNPEDATSSVVRYTASASTAANSPGATTTPVSSAVAANNSPATSAASSAAAPSQSGAYKFTALVVFGDNLSDNGNGSYAHNVAANNATDVVDGNTIYGARTWTDGPVAVSYLADLLGVPLTQNFAHGHAWGGSRAGATIDDTMVQSNFSASLADGPWYDHGEFSEPCWGAPSAKVQINDYLAGGVNKDALHSLWIGANDMDAAYGGTLAIGDTALNNKFADNISTKIPNLGTCFRSLCSLY